MMIKSPTTMVLGLLASSALSFLSAQSPPSQPYMTDSIEPIVTETVSVQSWLEDDRNAKEFQVEGTQIYTYPAMLNCGQILENLEAPDGARIIIPLQMDEGIIRTTLRMNGTQGDADIYLSYGEVPGLHSYEYRPYVNGNQEEILLENPQPGRWFVMIHAYRGFSNVSLELSCVASQEEVAESDLDMDLDIELALYYELSGVGVTNRVRSAAIQNQLLNREGRQAFNVGNFDQALQIWTRWMEQDPQNPRPVSLVGDLYLRSGNLDKAIEFYRMSLEIQPGQIGLMSRLSRILDVEAGQQEESKKLINHFSRLFPHSSGVALAQAEWLIRRNRYQEAVEIITKVIEEDPENLNAMSLLHPLLRNQKERYQNMQNMLRIGQMPGREIGLGFAIKENNLLTRPESWVLMDFIYRMAGEAPSQEQRQLYQNLLPRETITVEDFKIGRMSTNWISSREEMWGEQGNLLLSADSSQTEAFLRLKRSDAMHNGFVEVSVDDSRGFFWIYARRGEGNMIRFGFADNGELYLQVWMNSHLVSNQIRVWSRLPGEATLRLELRGDGAVGYINGEAAFSSPASIPEEMGLGWWGIAPWSAKYGTASVTVSKIAGGPLPVRLGLIPERELREHSQPLSNLGSGPRMMDGTLTQKLNRFAFELSSLAPEWYQQSDRGDIIPLEFAEDQELRLLARYYRMRLLPMLRVRSYRALDIKQVADIALKDRMDGFTLLVDRMPEPDWLERAEDVVTDSGMTLHFILLDPRTGKASFRELCGTVGLFSGPRRVKTLPLEIAKGTGALRYTDEDPNTVIYFDETQFTP